jgi:hypothetical protein
MTTPLYTLRIAINGQPSISADEVALHALATTNATLVTSTIDGREYVTGRPHVSYGNDGERRVTGVTGVAAFRAVVKAAGARTRKTTRCIKVLPAAALLTARDTIDADWQRWAAAGLTHREMKIRGINHPAYRALLD